MKKLVSEVFGTKIVDYALKFGTGVLTARYLGPSDKGVMTFTMLVVSWTVMFGNFSFMDASIYFMGSRKYTLAQATSTSVVTALVSGLTYAAVLFGLVVGHLVKWPVGNTAIFFVLLTLIPFNLILNGCGSILQGLSQFRAYNLVALSRTVASLAGVLLAMGFATDRLMGISLALVGSSVVNALGVLWYMLRLCGGWPPFSWQYLKASLHYGLRSHLRLSFSLLSTQFDQFMLGVLMTPMDLGYYSIATALREGLLLLPESISVVLFPWVAGNQADAARMTARTSRVTLLAMVLAAAAMAAAAEPIVRLLYGRNFLPAVQPLYFLLGASVFRSFSRILTNYIYGVGRPQLCILSTGGGVLVGLILIYPLIKHYGITGAALTATLSAAVAALIDLVIMHRLSSWPFRRFIFPESGDLPRLSLL